MRQPVKITPDSLKDTIVAFNFLSDLPPEVLPGFLYQVLPKDFTYLQQAPSVGSIKVDTLNSIQLGVSKSIQFANETLTVQLNKNMLIFNLVDEYLGWEKYSKCFFDIIQMLFDNKCLKSIKRIGVRYISEYPNKSLSDILKEKPSIKTPYGDGMNITHRVEVRKDNYSIVLSLADKIMKPNSSESENEYSSLIDIDVFKLFSSPILGFEEVKRLTSEFHGIEKDVFFSILKKEFIESLNPVYS